jgi:hypothetical protein
MMFTSVALPTRVRPPNAIAPECRRARLAKLKLNYAA